MQIVHDDQDQDPPLPEVWSRFSLFVMCMSRTKVVLKWFIFGICLESCYSMCQQDGQIFRINVWIVE